MKKIYRVLPIVLGMMLLVACGTGAEKVLEPKQVADSLVAEVTWQDTLEEVDLSKVLALYGLTAEDVVQGTAYLSTNATAEEVAAFKAAEGKEAVVLAAVEARVAAQKASFESYNAAEVPKLEQAYIYTQGDCVILCVCDDVAEAKSVVETQE